MDIYFFSAVTLKTVSQYAVLNIEIVYYLCLYIVTNILSKNTTTVIISLLRRMVFVNGITPWRYSLLMPSIAGASGCSRQLHTGSSMHGPAKVSLACCHRAVRG